MSLVARLRARANSINAASRVASAVPPGVTGAGKANSSARSNGERRTLSQSGSAAYAASSAGLSSPPGPGSRAGDNANPDARGVGATAAARERGAMR